MFLRKPLSFVTALFALSMSTKVTAAPRTEPEICIASSSECDAILLFETGFQVGTRTGTQPSNPLAYNLEMGFLGKLSQRSALGATFGARASGFYTRAAIIPRYRYWLSDEVGLDITAGFLKGRGDLPNLSKYGASTGLALSLSDYISLGVEAETFMQDSELQTSLSAGVKFGAPITGRLFLGLLGIAFETGRRAEKPGFLKP
jgi:hypothetical protein